MKSNTDLQTIFDTSIRWENGLSDLYDVAEIGVKNEESNQVIARLKEGHRRNLAVLEKVNVADYGEVEWMKFAPQYSDEDMVPKKEIRRDSTPEEIIAAIMEYETKLKEFYSTVHRLLVTEKQKELFESLVRFKERQISGIANIGK